MHFTSRSSVKLLVLFAVSSTLANERPNIVVFISDDLGRLETSIYGSKEVRTPAMDRLAAAGMTFDNAYVASPSCCPNRFSLLTGLMPARHGAHPNHSQPKLGTKYLMPILKKLGYHVASFGKVAHERRDFDGLDFNSPEPREMSKNVEAYFAKNVVQQPVCLLVGDRRPHVPWTRELKYDPDTVTLPPWFIDTPETRQHWARYLTDITGMDEELGRILDFSRKRFGDNFIFVFTSDHGGQWPRGKWNLYDSGTRIPFTVMWPGHVRSGVRSDAMISWVDILPTLIGLSGGRIDHSIDGRSFADVLLAKASTHRTAIFTTHTGDGQMNVFPIRSVRIGNYKYIHNLRPDAWFTNHSDRLRKDGAGAFWDSWDAAAEKDARARAIVRQYYTRPEHELYNLQSDPFELINLANISEHHNRLDSLKAKLTAWTTSQGDAQQPHQAPYLNSEPLPDLKSKQDRRRKPGQKTTMLKPHPDAVANTHPPGEVDKPELVPFVVRDADRLPGIVIDEMDAELTGTWQYSTHTPPYVGLGYLHDQKKGKGKSSVTYTPDLPKEGIYEVRLSHCYNVRRSTNTPVTVHYAGGEKTIRINQQDVPKHKRLFRSLGRFPFESGRKGWVRISTEGTDGKYVIADAVQFIPSGQNEGLR